MSKSRQVTFEVIFEDSTDFEKMEEAAALLNVDVFRCIWVEPGPPAGFRDKYLDVGLCSFGDVQLCEHPPLFFPRTSSISPGVRGWNLITAFEAVYEGYRYRYLHHGEHGGWVRCETVAPVPLPANCQHVAYNVWHPTKDGVCGELITGGDGSTYFIRTVDGQKGLLHPVPFDWGADYHWSLEHPGTQRPLPC